MEVLEGLKNLLGDDHFLAFLAWCVLIWAWSRRKEK